jgi:hypothetical protein
LQIESSTSRGAWPPHKLNSRGKKVMTDETLNKQVLEVESRGKAQYGERWTANIRRLGQAFGTIDENTMRQAVRDPNAHANIYRAGEDARLRLLQAAQDSRTGDPATAAELEAEYSDIRAKQRDQYRKMKGR